VFLTSLTRRGCGAIVCHEGSDSTLSLADPAALPLLAELLSMPLAEAAPASSPAQRKAATLALRCGLASMESSGWRSDLSRQTDWRAHFSAVTQMVGFGPRR
jgi:hypothetical protein